MDNLEYSKEIFDPIHGFIKLTSNEISIIDSLYFQRLHNINQLGSLHFVFPTARNTRFSHSLGVLAITCKIIDNLKTISTSDGKIIKKFSLDKKNQELIRISAILHDIGHLPYSHCTEIVIGKYIENKFPQLKITKKFHEWLSGEIVKNTDIYNPKGIDPGIIVKDRENISQIINGNSKFTLLNQILHSELDSDRMDYLLRDSFSTGVSFGQIDIEQILRKMFLKQRDSTGNQTNDNIIVYSTDAINSIDNFYYSRMFMYNSVYYHKKSCYYDYLISEIYRIILYSENLEKISYLLPKKPDLILEPLFKGDLDEKNRRKFLEDWFSFDDYYLWNSFREIWIFFRNNEIENENQDLRKLRVLLNHLFERGRGGNMIWEINRLKNVNYDKKDENLDLVLEPVLNSLEEWIKTELQPDYKLPIIALYNKLNAPLSNVEKEDPVLLDEYEGDSLIFYNIEEEKFHFLHNVASSINFHNNNSKFYLFRVFYLGKEHSDEIKNKIIDKYNELKEEYLKIDSKPMNLEHSGT